MPALKARVENGRLKLDEPTDLPEGTVVTLEIAYDGDDLDDENVWRCTSRCVRASSR